MITQIDFIDMSSLYVHRSCSRYLLIDHIPNTSLIIKKLRYFNFFIIISTSHITSGVFIERLY